MRSDPEFKSVCCEGEVCRICGVEAARKVEEVILNDDPMKIRHPYTAYVCLEHFNALMGIKPKS